MITIGLTTWSDHPSLIKEKRPVQLSEYAAFFPVVEIDSTFYGIPKSKTILQWQKDVSSGFQFIVKAHREMTLHPNNPDTEALNDGQRNEVFHEFNKMVQPLVSKKQLKTVLFQFPPFFNATLEHFEYLRRVRQLLPKLPIAVEFRNQTWYESEIFSLVAQYMADLKMTLVAAQEPNQKSGSVPFVIEQTNDHLTMFRLHGLNQKGWGNPGEGWRKIRTLYRYSEAELLNLASEVQAAAQNVQEVCVIFNNNSGHDAADNAQRLAEILGLNFNGLNKQPPEQLDLF